MDFLKRPTYLDAVILSIFTVLITLQPYFMHGKINIFEFGLYLPGIQSILNGEIPYRDFFHLRGPFELYMPAFMMRLFGENIAVLSSYFYIGTVITLISCVFIAKELYKTRCVLYLMIPVLIGRTFPRVVFTFWGGMRFALGLLAVLFAVYFFRRKKYIWIFFSGTVSSLAFLTSIDTGVCTILSILATLIFAWFFGLKRKREAMKSLSFYSLGLLSVLLPYGIYLFATQALVPFIDSMYSIMIIMTKVFPDSAFRDHPSSLWEAILAMGPWSKHFKHLTPAYCYIFVISYIAFKTKKKLLSKVDLSLVCVFFYGLILYIFAFRKLGSAAFEMALQPEKILLFFLLEVIFLILLEKRNLFKAQVLSGALAIRKYLKIKIILINFFCFALIGSSIGYTIARYNHRFFSFKYVRNLIIQKKEDLRPLAGDKTKRLTLERVRGMVVPVSQAEDIEQISEFFQKHTKPREPVFMFPEIGSYSFIVDRPFVGRFPMVTFSWFGVNWHEELFQDLQEVRPQFAVIPKELAPHFEELYFLVQENRKKYRQVLDYVYTNYELVQSTPTLNIYKSKY